MIKRLTQILHQFLCYLVFPKILEKVIHVRSNFYVSTIFYILIILVLGIPTHIMAVLLFIGNLPQPIDNGNYNVGIIRD